MYDIIIIGGGPAGLTAAVYCRRADKSVLVIEKGSFGGQITFSPQVENIPGFESVSGNEFAEKLVSQAIYQDVEMESCEVLSIRDNGATKTVVTDDGEFEGKAVIIATGAKHRLLGVPNEEKFIGDGISFCAVCDGAFYKGQTVGVVGGGNSALQEALLLADLCEKVYVFQNLPNLTGEQKLCQRVYDADNIEVICSVCVKSVVGDDKFEGVILKEDGQNERSYTLDGLFVAIGLLPQNEPFKDLITLNDYGYADSDECCTTRTEGIFVAGDCRSKKIRQVTTAVGDGAVAALAACDYIDKQ